MKNFTTLLQEAKLDIQEDTLNYISAGQLKEYKEIAGPFISDEAKKIIDYLIEHDDYKDLGDGKNPLASFYEKGVPSDPEKKELYKNIGVLSKKSKLMEIPLFLTKPQFEAIISKKESPDKIIIDLDTEKGRNKVAKAYEPLLHKICRQFLGKSNLDYDELMSAAYTGLTYAMNRYGKRNESEAEDEKISATTFGQYAAQWIRIYILEDIKTNSRTVRVPASQQNRERQETGVNVKNNTISGDDVVGGGSEEGNKTVFDYIGGAEDAGKSLDNGDLNKLWRNIYRKLGEKFDKETLDIWMSFYGLNGHEKMQNKELAAKYGISSSNVTYYLAKVNNYIKKDPKMLSMMTDVYELTKECLNDLDREEINEAGDLKNLTNLDED